MSAETWRSLDSGPMPGAYNMALDEAMLEAHLRGETSPTVRFYTWRPRAISLGRFQEVASSLDLAACRDSGVHVVRRPTGGRAILHTEEEVTFSVVVSEERLGARGTMACYQALASAIVAGLRELGLEARLAERAGPWEARPGVDPACFAVKARCDLVVGSSKLVGSAQLHRTGAILQQNSLPLRLHVEEWARLFRRRAQPPAAVGLWEAAGSRLPYARVTEALRRGFERVFGVELADAEPTAAELQRASELLSVADLLNVSAPA
ncbi:MAG: biotin/lipoate A/B protein ligase family protein [Armatimonadota bacterium]